MPFTVLGLSQLFHAVGMRDVGRSVVPVNHLENRLMLAAAALGVLLQVLVTENSRLVALFQTAALSGTRMEGAAVSGSRSPGGP